MCFYLVFFIEYLFGRILEFRRGIFTFLIRGFCRLFLSWGRVYVSIVVGFLSLFVGIACGVGIILGRFF